MKLTILNFILSLCAALASGSSFAHHSFAQFDVSKTITLSGTVKEFQWTNPHTWVEMEVINAKGGVEQWSLESEAPGVLKNRGWNKATLKVGDKITFSTHPKRDGSPGGSLVSITFADGKVLGLPEPPAAAAARAAAEAENKK